MPALMICISPARCRVLCRFHRSHDLRCVFSSSEAWSTAERVPGIWLNAFNDQKSWIMRLYRTTSLAVAKLTALVAVRTA